VFSTHDVFSSGMIHGGCNWRLKAQFICDVMEFIYQPFQILGSFDCAMREIRVQFEDYSKCYLNDTQNYDVVAQPSMFPERLQHRLP
jgi:hypothetical protein